MEVGADVDVAPVRPRWVERTLGTGHPLEHTGNPPRSSAVARRLAPHGSMGTVEPDLVLATKRRVDQLDPRLLAGVLFKGVPTWSHSPRL